jgi:hypothetical protein
MYNDSNVNTSLLIISRTSRQKVDDDLEILKKITTAMT